MTENFSKGKPKKYGSLQQGAQARWRPPWRRCPIREDPKGDKCSGKQLGERPARWKGPISDIRGLGSITWNKVQEMAAWGVGLRDPCSGVCPKSNGEPTQVLQGL